MTTNPLRDQIVTTLMAAMPDGWVGGWTHMPQTQAMEIAYRLSALLDAQAPQAEPVADADIKWLVDHLTDYADVCSEVNGSRDPATLEARRIEVTVKKLARLAAPPSPQPTDNTALVEAVNEAIYLLKERKHGSPARSPAHNARLVLEAALSRAPQPAPDAVAEAELDHAWLRESELRQALKAAMDDEPGWYDLARDARNTSLAARAERVKARALASQDKVAQG